MIPSQRVTKKPYEAWVCVSNNGHVKSAHCQCMAGLGQVCVHVAAVLFKVEAAVKYGFTVKASTSEACKWNKQFRKEISMCPVSEMGSDLIKSKRKVEVISVCSSSQDLLPDIDVLNSLKTCCPSAVFFTLIPKLDFCDTDTAEEDDTSNPLSLITLIGDEISAAARQRTDEEAVNLYIEQCTLSKIEELESKTREQSNSFLWFLHRKGRITGSIVHDVLHHREANPTDKLVIRIVGYNETDISHLKAVEWGINNESTAFKHFFDIESVKHAKFVCRKVGFLIDSNDVFLGASADGIVECDCHGRGTLEIKCPFKHREVHPLKAAEQDKQFCLSTNGELKTNHKYYSQIQLQMHVHRVEYCYLHLSCIAWGFDFI